MDDCEWKVKLGLGLHRKGTKRQLTRGLAPCPTDFKPPFTRWWWILSILWKIGFDDYLDENYKRVRMWFPSRLCQKSWHYRKKRVWPILLLGLSSLCRSTKQMTKKLHQCPFKDKCLDFGSAWEVDLTLMPRWRWWGGWGGFDGGEFNRLTRRTMGTIWSAPGGGRGGNCNMA